MHIETPKMYVRRVLGLDATWEAALKCSILTMRGSGTNLQPDGSAIYMDLASDITPYQRTSRQTLIGDINAKAAVTSGTFPTVDSAGAGNDWVHIMVGTTSGDSTENLRVLLGAGASTGIIHRCQLNQTDAAGLLVKDGTNSDTVYYTTSGVKSGSIILSVAARVDGELTKETSQYIYNLSQDAVLVDTGVTATVTGTITPATDKGNIGDWPEFYGSVLFEFNGNAPSNWREVCVAMAKELVAAKS